ncbi:MAG: polysaccharide deacetylase family protein [Clostridia bacterium]|nr:polysaccharide deacetylase family protein [Clostridia bacterium]
MNRTAKLFVLSFVLLLLGGFTAAPGLGQEPAETLPPETYLARRDADMKRWLLAYDATLTDAQADEIVRTRAIDPEKPMVALTFDDGPVAGVTDKLLDILEENNARATFFVLGAKLKKEPNAAILPRMLSLGCEIGNHTFNHVRLKNVSKKAGLKEVTRVNERVAELTGGYAVTSLRPPGGMTNNHVINMAADAGMSLILWSQSCDVNELSPERIAANVLVQPKNKRELQSGDIVLLHDTKDRMVDAMSILIPQLVADGWQLVTVQELLSLSEAGYIPGIQYTSATDYHGLLKTVKK